MAVSMPPLGVSPKSNNGVLPSFCCQEIEELDEISSQAKILLSKLKEEFSCVASKKQNNTDELVETIERIRRRTDDLKHQLDVIARKLILEAERVFKKNLRVLETAERQLKLQSDQLRTFIQRCDMAQTSSHNEYQLDDIKEILTSFKDRPPQQLPPLLRMRFKNSSVDLEKEQNVIGTLNKREREIVDTDSILSSSASEASNILPTSATAFKLAPMKMLSHRAKAISCIATTCDKTAWVGCGGKKLNLVTSKDGSFINSIKFDTDVNDVSCSENGLMTIVCCSDKTVREIIANGKPKVRFKLNEKPLSMSLTPELEVVVGFEFCVCKYSLDGVLVCETPVAETVNKVAVNNSSGDIAVAMSSKLDLFDRNLTHKLAINKTDMENCTFFHPGDVVFDSNQNLLVIDFFTESFILFDGLTGQLLSKKKSNQIQPFSICIQKGDLLWIGGKNGKIRIVRIVRS